MLGAQTTQKRPTGVGWPFALIMLVVMGRIELPTYGL